MAPNQVQFKHGTAELWIVGIVSTILLLGATWFIKSSTDAVSVQATQFAELRERFIKVESKVDSVHLALVDVPQIKMEQARFDMRLQYLEEEQRAAEREKEHSR